MPTSFRRIVTAHDHQGGEIVRSIDLLTHTPIAAGTADFQLIWTTPTVPADLNRNDDGMQEADLTLRSGSVIRIVEIPPGQASPMHRSFSIDYGTVLAGRLQLEIDDGKVVDLAQTILLCSGEPIICGAILVLARPVASPLF